MIRPLILSSRAGRSPSFIARALNTKHKLTKPLKAIGVKALMVREDREVPSVFASMPHFSCVSKNQTKGTLNSSKSTRKSNESDLANDEFITFVR